MRVKSSWFVVASAFIVVLCRQGKMVADSLNKHVKNADDFMSKGNIESAITEYQKALRRDPDSVWAQSRLGMAYEQLGNGLFAQGAVQAIEACKNALLAAPAEPYWHERLGLGLEKKGDREAAVNEHRTAAELLPLDDRLQLKYEQVSGAPYSTEDACIRKVKGTAATTTVQCQN